MLNREQQQAVDTLQGPVMVLAGAGSGKTRVIIHRIANLIQHGVSPKNILAVTFTNKAAKEMRERIGALLSNAVASAVTVSTFHAFCLGVLRKFIHKLGFSRHFAIAGEGYQRDLIKTIAIENNLIRDGCDAGYWLSCISRAKGNLETPDDVAESGLSRAADIAAVFRIYQTRLKQMDLVDFDDLLCLTVELWQKHPDILQGYRDIYTYILIDEYQDTNATQLRIMQMLAGDTRNICVVGDDDQSIYGWRGANLGNILQFETYFPGAAVIRLEQNYRSTNTILKAANALIAQNANRRPKELWSAEGEGDKILAVRCEDETKEAEFVASYIRDAAARGTAWSDFAVLFRAGRQSRILEEVFRRKRVPYSLVGANSFYKRKEILDAIAFLRLIQNPKNDLAMLQVINVPPREAGDATIEKLRAIRDVTNLSIEEAIATSSFLDAAPAKTRQNLLDFTSTLRAFRNRPHAGCAIAPFVKDFLDAIGYFKGLARMYKPLEDAQARRDNVLELITAIGNYDDNHHCNGSLQDYLEQLDLQDANDRHQDQKDSAGQAVTLMTVHASKGLEFPQVIVVGLEQGLFPHQTALDEGNLEEERRLCYVAITRAKRRLLLTYADRRREMNQVHAKRPSHFIDEIPEEFIEFTTPDKAIKPADPKDVADMFAAMRAKWGN